MVFVKYTPEQKLERAEAETVRKAGIAAKKAASAEKRAEAEAAKAGRKADREAKQLKKRCRTLLAVWRRRMVPVLKAKRQLKRLRERKASEDERKLKKANRILKKNLKVWVKFQPKQLHKGVIKLKKRVERDAKAAAKAAAEPPTPPSTVIVQSVEIPTQNEEVIETVVQPELLPSPKEATDEFPTLELDVESIAQDEPPTREYLMSLSKSELHKHCEERRVKSYKSLNKDKLVATLLAA